MKKKAVVGLRSMPCLRAGGRSYKDTIKPFILAI